MPDFETPFDPAPAANEGFSLRARLQDLGVREDNVPAHLAFVAANPSIDIKTYPASFAG